MCDSVSRHQVREFLLGGTATYGTLWLLAEPIGAFLPSLSLEGLKWYVPFLALSVIGGTWHAWPTKRIAFQIPMTDSSIEIKFGDVFAGKGVVVIPVNEYFDGELGDPVSKKSLHGQFIKSVLGGDSKQFVALTNAALAACSPQACVQRPSGQCNRYGIGTVARLDVDQQRYLLAALSHTDLVSLKASATVDDLWTCLTGVWKGVRQHAGGSPVKVPLIGSGLSGTGLPPKILTEIIVTSFVCATKVQKVADSVTLVLPCRLTGKLDLKNIKRRWI